MHTGEGPLVEVMHFSLFFTCPRVQHSYLDPHPFETEKCVYLYIPFRQETAFCHLIVIV